MSDIARDIMNSKRVKKLRRELDKLRGKKSEYKRRELSSFAAKIGRERRPRDNKEPQWVSTLLGRLRPISIPGHPTIKRFTAQSILDSFEVDLDALDEIAEE